MRQVEPLSQISRSRVCSILTAALMKRPHIFWGGREFIEVRLPACCDSTRSLEHSLRSSPERGRLHGTSHKTLLTRDITTSEFDDAEEAIATVLTRTSGV